MIAVPVNTATLARWQQELRKVAEHERQFGSRVNAAVLSRVADEMDDAMQKSPAKPTFSHDTPADGSERGTAFMHCSLCLAERPEHLAPRDWARLNVALTPTGFQVWCTRHDVNVNDVTVTIGGAK